MIELIISIKLKMDSGFHENLLKNRKLLIACPKLDDAGLCIEKLAEVFRLNDIKSITVLRMIVPCCGGLNWIVKEAIKRAQVEIPMEEKIVDIEGVLRISK
ncbi:MULTISPECIES: hypothetical protein [Thermodesulfovibrio]|uniref:Ferredoxin n=2 Tax=Thermodesulfovibrio TaxID=28261 RepID=A0AAU8H708_9BACT